MPKLLKVLGWLLVIPGGLLLLLAPFAAIDRDLGAGVGMVILAAIPGTPGLLMLLSGLRRGREQALQAQMVGFVRSHDAFSINELAAHIGKTPAEAQALLNQDIARYRLPLVMHRASGRYLRLDRLAQNAQVAEQCQSCGGALGNQVVFEGEQLRCPYCGTDVRTHAAPQPTWQHAQGGWVQQQQQQQQQQHWGQQ